MVESPPPENDPILLRLESVARRVNDSGMISTRKVGKSDDILVTHELPLAKNPPGPLCTSLRLGVHEGALLLRTTRYLSLQYAA